MARALTGRAALVTGAAGGFGRVITWALLQAGACVMATDVSDSGLETLGRQMTSEGLASGLALRHLDISDHKACTATVEVVWDRFQSLGILINNGALGMAVIRDDHLTNLVAIEEITPETWDRFVAVNLSGAWYLTRAAVPGMKRAGWGRIITITTSFFTMLRSKFHPYGPVKAGIEAMTAGHAKEFANDGITVNVVVPGTALPGLAVRAAELPALRCVYAMQAYPLVVRLNCIAVDHRGDAGHIGQGWGGEQGQGDGGQLYDV